MRPIFKSVAFARRLAISMGTQSILTVLLREAKPGCKQAIQRAAAAMFLLGLIAPAVWAQNTVQTVAGGGPNNLPALKSSLGSPTSLALDGVGNVYVADLYSARVLRVDTNGNVTVVAGNAARGGIFNAQGVPAITARLTYPTGVAVDALGNIFIADQTYCLVREVSATTGNISTVAGTSICGYSGDGGPATSAQVNDPTGVAVDKFGNILITDRNNCLIRRIIASTGVISTLAGTPPDITGLLHCGNSGDGGPALNAKLGFANGLAVDGSGNIFIADTTNCAVREISASAGTISTVAGTGTCGYSGDGGAATSAQINQPYGVTVDRFGNVFIADTTNCVIRKVSSSNAQISTVGGDEVAGCGYSGDGGLATSAQIDQPYGVAVDSAGNIFVADYKNSVIREVSASTASVSTFAGVAVPDPIHVGNMIGLPALSGDGYLGTDAEFGFLNDTPYGAGLATDRSGNIFVADTANNAVRKVSASTGLITTVAGNGLIGYSGDGGPATSATLFYPRDVTVDGSGNIFIMDTGNCVVRKIAASTGIISTVAGTPPDSAGNYYCDFSGDGGPATSAELYPIDLLTPAGGVAVDSSGNVYIADTGNNVIRKVTASTGIISTVAGIPLSLLGTSPGDGGPATSAALGAPYGVAVDSSGDVFIADSYNFAIREVAAVNNNIYTVAGNMALGQGFSGDGGPAGLASLRFIFGGLSLDAAGNLFIPDPVNCVIREVSGSTGNITTVAGTRNPTGTYFCGFSGDGGPALSAVFDNPSAAGPGASGDLIVLDSVRVRSVAGVVQGPAAGAVPFPSPLTFPDQPLGTSNTLTVVLSNRGSLPTNVASVAISGTNASVFSETDNCVGRSLAAGGASCLLSVKFAPSVATTDGALLTITDTAGTQTVGLTGTGVLAPGFSPSVPTIPFGNQQKSVKSSPMSVTVTNNGTAGLTFGGVSASGAYDFDFAISANSCTGTVAVNDSCSVSVTFTPSTTGAETASLIFTDNAAGSPQSVGLTGSGTDFSMGIAPGGSATATVQAGSPTTYNLQVTAVSGFNGAVALSCTGAPTESTCMPSEASVTLSGSNSAAFSVQVTTMAPSIALPRIRPHSRPFDGPRILLMLFMFALASTPLAFTSRFRGAAAEWRRASAFAIPLGFLVLASAFLAGCGGAGTTTSQPNPGTQKGNYILTITGTSNGVSHSQTVTLTVN